ncbi:MAG TPA: prenyltransferase/squalene oxidase repeat-containing protein [Vicinamibacteria bacterium]
MASGAAGPKKVTPAVPVARGPLDPAVQRGLEWLVKAQHPDGGWGAGSHANQQMRDPRQVVTDPATTAFVAMALVRTGSTPESGPHREALQRATLYLVQAVESAPAQGPRITQIEGTQPQAKLGALVDTGMASQYLARILPTLTPGSPLHKRVDAALDRCVHKLEESQQADGTWNGAGGWAPVLQSSLSTSALEMAQAAGKRVDGTKLDRARQYQKGNFDAASGRAEAGAAAGVELYAFSSAQRAGALEAVDAVAQLDAAKEKGVLPSSAPVSEENLKKAGVEPAKARSLSQAYQAQNAQLRRLADDQLLSGFGSNGGEEYLSYLQTSESLVIAGNGGWEAWKQKMSARLAKIQSQDGSWTGHHCITSPVFCTAAVLQCLTADRDAVSLRRLVQVGRKG